MAGPPRPCPRSKRFWCPESAVPSRALVRELRRTRTEGYWQVLILIPLFDLTLPGRAFREWSRNFKSAALRIVPHCRGLGSGILEFANPVSEPLHSVSAEARAGRR